MKIAYTVTALMILSGLIIMIYVDTLNNPNLEDLAFFILGAILAIYALRKLKTL